MSAKNSVAEKEQKLLEFWHKDATFEKSLQLRKGSKEYVFYDGPPFATGLPHYGHLMASIAKDVIPRFWTMKGFLVNRQWGWDCHGLPVENIVERQLGIKSKDEIEKMGVAKFNAACRESVLTYAGEWKKTVDRIARWVEFDNSYKTMDTTYIESVWWAFKQLYEKDYIYKGEKILMYCPHCVTPLAKSEISMDNSYKTISDISVAVKFKLEDEDAHIIAWTTTPWTLPSNLALAVHPEMEYAYVKDKTDGNTYVLAKELVGSYFKNEIGYEITKVLKGRELLGKKYGPLFDYFTGHEHAFEVIAGDFVTASEGTGVVHTAPAFGEEDYDICKKHGIAMVQPVDETGHFTSEVKDFAGKYIHTVNEEIVKFLAEKGRVVFSKKIKHEYPFCYRCDTKLMYRALPAWFVNIQKIKQRMLELIKDINWHPGFVKEGRFKHIVETAPDWNISRNRYWATAIPIWESKTGERLVVGSVEELKTYATNLPNKEIDLHKDYLDEIVLEKDSIKYKRVPEVMDCWFESGSMPFAQFHYPFENKEHFEKHLPAQYVVEYIGQTRTWFYYMVALSTILFDKIPFENVHVTGNILAADGTKMSKSKRNFTDPHEIIEKYGADALRFYLMSSPFMNAMDGNFLDSGVEEIYKKVVLMTYNLSNFYKDYETVPLAEKESKHVMDRWILTRAHTLVRDVELHLSSYNTVKACKAVRTFIDELSTWYVRTSRERFAKNDTFAKRTLHLVLDILSRTVAPLMPFAAEHMHGVLASNGVSVHLQDWPPFDESLVDSELEREMEAAREIVSQTLRRRDQEQIGIRWPLRNLIMFGPKPLREELREIICKEVNVKGFEYCKADTTGIELDTTLTKELEAEGFAREIVRKIQAARRDENLVKTDRIQLCIVSEFDEALQLHTDFISERVGATELTFGLCKAFNHSTAGKIKGKTYEIHFSKI